MLIRPERAGRAFVTVAAALTLAAVFASGVEAASAGVRSACADDYFAYCSQHDPDGQGVRQCMRANGSRLSSTCIDALAAAGEIPKRQLAKRSTPRRQ